MEETEKLKDESASKRDSLREAKRDSLRDSKRDSLNDRKRDSLRDSKRDSLIESGRDSPRIGEMKRQPERGDSLRKQTESCKTPAERKRYSGKSLQRQHSVMEENDKKRGQSNP